MTNEAYRNESPGAAGPARGLVVATVGALILGVVAAVARWEWARPGETVAVELAAYERAAARAPWLAGLYGTGAAQAEEAGDLAGALRQYTRVLEALPGHPGTSLARARVLYRMGAVAEPEARGQALADLDAAERGLRVQRALLAAADAAAHRDAGESVATAALLEEVSAMRRLVEEAGRR